MIFLDVIISKLMTKLKPLLRVKFKYLFVVYKNKK
jgi:hypothetical protein